MLVLILIQVVFSLALLALVWSLFRTRPGQAAAWSAAGVASIVFLPFSVALVLQSFFTLVAAFICWGFRLPRPVFLALALLAMAASYGIVGWTTSNDVRELVQLKQDYPFQSLEMRLQYESQPQQQSENAESAETPIVLNTDVENRLQRFESRLSSDMRRYMLQALHERTAEQFAAAQGFGAVRMLRVHREQIELPVPEAIPFPKAPAEEPYCPDDVRPQNPLMARKLDKRTLLSLHQEGLEDFLEQERMGYVKDRRHVAGFDSHAFTQMPQVYSGGVEKVDWQLSKLELVSLLRHAEPVAYVSQHLPRMEELRSAPTRELDEFERAALGKLRQDEDLVTQDRPRRIRMLGSVRAGNDCLDCHSVRRGELLGAFSYELTPSAAPPAADSQRAPNPQARSARTGVSPDQAI